MDLNHRTVSLMPSSIEVEGLRSSKFFSIAGVRGMVDPV